MASNGNGTTTTIKVIMFVLAVLGSGITVYSVFHVPLVRAVEEERSCRQIEDIRLTSALTDAIQEQQKTNETTNVILAKLLTKVEYIERAVK